MFTKHAIHTIAAAALALVAAGPASAADIFPSQMVRLVVNTAPGGLVDTTARLVAQKMTESLGQPVIVENRPGADGLIGIRAVKAAAPDGYTVLVTAGTVAIQPAVKLNPGYDLVKDFTGVAPLIRSPLMMVVGPNQPDKTLAQFIARAKANPDKLTYSSAGVGTTTHVGAAMFLQQSGLKLLHVPYKGNGAAFPDLMSGRVDMLFDAYGSGASKVSQGAMRALAVTSTSRLTGLPQVPTIAEQAVPNFKYYLYVGVLAPAGTPKNVVNRLAEAFRSATAHKDLKERFRTDGAEVMDMSPEDFTAFLKQDLVTMSKLMTELGIPKQ